MTRISEERQQSNIRAARVETAVSEALVQCAEQNPGLTYEEILAALLSIAQRQVMHLRSEEPE